MWVVLMTICQIFQLPTFCHIVELHFLVPFVVINDDVICTAKDMWVKQYGSFLGENFKSLYTVQNVSIMKAQK